MDSGHRPRQGQEAAGRPLRRDTLRRVRTAVLTDQRPVTASTRRNELIHRLLAGQCEICGSTAGLEVHHIRMLADLNRPGRRKKPAWMHLMAVRRRKFLVICRRCHEDIHAGRSTALPEMITGEQGTGKPASPVREETDGKGPCQGTSPTVDFTRREAARKRPVPNRARTSPCGVPYVFAKQGQPATGRRVIGLRRP